LPDLTLIKLIHTDTVFFSSTLSIV